MRKIANMSWSSELELEVRGQYAGVRSQYAGVRRQSWSSELELAVERKSERADTAYSPRFREEELPDADNERNCGGGAKLAARVGCVFGI